MLWGGEEKSGLGRAAIGTGCKARVLPHMLRGHLALPLLQQISFSKGQVKAPLWWLRLVTALGQDN